MPAARRSVCPTTHSRLSHLARSVSGVSPDERAALDRYLSPPEWTEIEGGMRVCSESSFSAALRDARGATGRDESGEVEIPEKSASWLGAMGYLAFLDQVGTAVRLEDFAAEPSEPALRRAIRQFSPVSRPDAFALQGLRNSLVHDYSLFSQYAPGGKVAVGSDRHYAFVFEVEGEELVQRAAQPWSGILHPDELPFECRTVVSLRHVGDLAESVRARVVEEHARGRLRIALDGGADEMSVRYRFMFGTDA